MKRYDNLFEKIADYDNLYEAYRDAARGKRYKQGSMEYWARLEVNLMKLREELLTDTFKPQPYHEFELRTEVKRRIVAAPTFRDCVAQHAILRLINDLFEKKMIYDSYATRIGKGNHRAQKRTQYFLRKLETCYVLQGDVHQYFPSIDHETLKRDISRTIADERLLCLIGKIIDGYHGETGKGIPIGAPLSQLLAGVYLTPFDHFIKETLREKFYVRLMDDFVILNRDKNRLREELPLIRDFLKENRKLEMNLKKTQIYPSIRGIDFAGYRTFKTHTLPRKRNLKAAKLRFKTISWLHKHNAISEAAIRARVASFRGYIKHCDAHRSAESVFKHLVIT